MNNSERVVVLRLVLLLLLTAHRASAGIVHVDADAGGPGDGTSWADAFPSLQDGLAAASPGDQVWVAEGSYRPDDGAAQTPGDRAATFALASGVAVYGGFDGTETSLVQRAGLFDTTILDGDLLGDDGPDFTGYADNSFHVVTAEGVDATARLDGFTVRGGHAGGEPAGGGGLTIEDSSPMVARCTFVDNAGNAAIFGGGGGARIASGAPTFWRCTFRGNVPGIDCTFGSGGGLSNSGDPLLVECLFESNRFRCTDGLIGSASGGGMSSGGSPVLVRCAFVGNSADGTGADGGGGSGGGLHASGTPFLVGCVFVGNIAAGSSARGGGVTILLGTATFVGCVVSGNVVDAGGAFSSGGGGLALDESDGTIVNCSIVGNEARGDLFPLVPAGGVLVTEGTVAVSGSILWNNTGALGDTVEEQQILVGAPAGGTLTVDFSCVEGLSGALGGTGNIGVDPLFVDADGADDVVGTIDDDLRLLAGSPCIDAGDNTALPADVGDLDCDGDAAEATPLDADGRVRRHDDGATADTGNGTRPIVDMGAYELDAPLPDEAWADLAGGLAGTHGVPLLTGVGSLCPDAPLEVLLTGALENTVAGLVLGLSVLGAPFKGGVLVPNPDVVVLGIPTGPAGRILVRGSTPDGAPPGLTLLWQWWVTDGAAPFGFAASNAVVGTVP